MEFKIGDKVLVKYGKSSSSRELAGKICTIEKAYPLFCVLEEEEGNDIYEKGGVWNEDIELYEEKFPEKWCLKIETKEINEAVNSINLWKLGQLYWQDNNAYRDRWISFDKKYLQKYETNNYTEITFDQFKKHILKESTTMKNLLETEFVIENCSLGQRAAIKHYCEEKGIKQLNLETPKFNVVTFSNRQFKCFLTSSVPHNKITFSELIQFLDKYQPEPEFKVGDFLITIEDSGNATSSKSYKKSYYGKEVVLEIEKFEDSSNGLLAVCKNGYVVYLEYMPIKFVRHATLEEIERWKEENEIKLPRIDACSGEHSTTKLKWGCTTISIATVKELLKLKLTHINFEDGREADYKQIQQIKKFIEHNNL